MRNLFQGTKLGCFQGTLQLRPIKDIKLVLFFGYSVGYLLAVLAPILIDPVLKSHPTFPLRTYPYAKFCALIYVLLILTQLLILTLASRTVFLYLSVCVFIASIVASLPIFLPEFPHANVVAVGATISFFSALSIFVWSIGREVMIDANAVKSGGEATMEYMKVLFTFLRQAAFACVALFGALFLAAYATGFKFVEATATDKSDIFLLYVNIGFQVSFYGIYAIVGPVRYFFGMNIHILSQFRETAIRLDRQRDNAGDRNTGTSGLNSAPSSKGSPASDPEG